MKLKTIFYPLIIFLLCLSVNVTSNAQTQDSTFIDSLENYRIAQLDKYSERLQYLRQELAITFNKYIEGFDQKKLNEKSFDHLNELRGELKSKVASMVENGTSGEATVALNKAKIDMLIEEINAIERFLGGKKGAFTNEFNVFSLEDLLNLSEKIKSQIGEIKKSLEGRLPSNEIPTDLLQRKNELLNIQSDVQNEIKYRQSVSKEAILKAVDKTINIDRLKATEPVLEKFKEANREKFYNEKLRFQIQLRLHSSPKDASLITLRNNFNIKDSPYSKSISARPPPSQWKNPVNEVIIEIRDALFAEQKAIELRKPLDIAKARTNSTIYQNWLNVGVPNLTINSSYDILNISDLQILKTRNIRWLVNLHHEYGKTSKTTTALEIQEAELRIADIEKSIRQKANTFPNESLIVKTKFARPPPTSLKNFEAKLPFFEKQIEARELRLLIDKPIHITDLTVKTAYEKNIQILRQLESDALTYGKGKKGAVVIDELIEAQKSK